MARLTERELTLIRRARQLSWQRLGAAINLVQVLNAARAAQAAAVGSDLARGFKLLARYSGLSDLAHLTKTGLIDPLRRGACYRRTLEELRHLDAHRLADIGMTREDLERFAWQAAVKEVPAAEFRPWLVTRLRLYPRRQSLIRSLASLDDRSLADIGIERADIGSVVDQMLAKEYPEPKSDDVAPDHAAARKPRGPRSPSFDILKEVAAEPSPLDVFKLAKARHAT